MSASQASLLERARTLESQGHWDEAFDLIEEAYRENPNPTLAAEYGIGLCYQAREEEALRILDAAEGGRRIGDLIAILAAHFFARRQMAKKLQKEDPHAESAWKAIRKRAKEVGIRLDQLPPPTLSAVLIVRNEAKHIADCIRSIQPVCDEVIVVDTGSTDDTMAIAKSLGARVSTFEWRDDFSAARNYALSLARGTWCFWIDADERLDAGSYGAVLSALVRPHFGGFTLEIVNYLEDDTRVGQLVHRPCRIFRNLPDVRFEGRIHEQITPSLSRIGLPVALLEARLLHYGYRREEVEAKQKHDRTLALVQAALQENPNDSFQQFNLANAYYCANRFAEAATWFEKMAETIPTDAAYGQHAFHCWALSLVQLERWQEAIRVCDRAQRQGFGGPLVEYARALALYHLGQLDEALGCVERAKSLTLKPEETGNRDVVAYKLDFLRGQVLAATGRADEAAETYRKVLQVAPAFHSARLALAIALRAQGKAKEAFEEAAALAAESEELAIAATDLVLQCAQEIREPLRAVRVCAKAVEAHPNSRALWERWVAAAEVAEDWPSVALACSHFAHHFEAESDVLIRAARALTHLGRYQLALQCLEDACGLDPENPNLYWHLGDLFSKCERWADAALAYRKGLTLDSSNADAWFTLGNALYYLGKPDAAVLAFETALSLQPGHSKAEHNLSIARQEIRERAS
jgi:tetratricopeptide (TPR) repeat protein